MIERYGVTSGSSRRRSPVHISKSGQERPDLTPLVEVLKTLSIR